MLAVGLVCGAVLTALYVGYQENEAGRFGSGIRTLLEQEERTTGQDQASASTEAPEPEPRVKLDYHEVLPNIDKVISESDLAVEEEPVRERPNYRYILQTGSYRSGRDAEGMKAKLALAGFEAVIQRVNINQKGTYYRVRMGPYTSRRKLQLDRKRLARQGIDSMAIRLEAPGEQTKQTD